MKKLQPLIQQRADPFIGKYSDPGCAGGSAEASGYYYFTASVPAYDRIELRRARTIAELPNAAPVDIWHKPDTGPMSELIWAPEIHRIDNAWYIYFAAAPSRAIKDDLFQHRIYVITTRADNPLEGQWTVLGRVDTGMDSFCLDSTTFEHRNIRYFVWAQKDPAIPGNSNLYIARMKSPSELATQPVRLSIPEFEWETRGFAVNEGPSVLIRHGCVFMSYSASATDENYCMGLLHAREDADLLDPRSWAKAPQPVFKTCYSPGGVGLATASAAAGTITPPGGHGVYGPGHNSFTVAEDGKTDLLVYHARTYSKIEGDPLWDPNRHTYVKPFRWDAQGMPVFGLPSVAE